MKRTVILLLSMMALPLLAGERDEKRALIAEFYEVMDVKATIRESIDRMFAVMLELEMDSEAELSPEDRAAMDAMKQQRQEQLVAFRERLFTHIDFNALAETVYTPVLEENFSAEDLKALIAFAKTKPGQRFIQIVPQMGMSLFARGERLMQEASEAAAEEMQKEEEQKKPWLRTMADMRSLATAVEARATDTEDYPKVMTLSDLERLISPTYIRTVPRTDTWGTEYLYVSDGTSYRFVSAGADKRFEWNARQLEAVTEPRAMESIDADIIFQDGLFIQYPKDSDLQQ